MSRGIKKVLVDYPTETHEDLRQKINELELTWGEAIEKGINILYRNRKLIKGDR